MLNAEPQLSRPTLLNAASLARALDGLRPKVRSPAEMWRLLTDQYVVDLDAVAALVPSEESETRWLVAGRRGRSDRGSTFGIGPRAGAG